VSAAAKAAPAPDPLVYGFDALGDAIKLPAKDADQLVRLGGRVATAEEASESKLREDYAKQSTVEKVLSSSSLMAPALQATGIVDPLQVKALQRSIFQGATAGLGSGLLRQGIEKVSGAEAANKFAEDSKDYEAAFPATSTYGEAAGMLGGSIAGSSEAGIGARGLARILPSSLIGKVGLGAESLAARALPAATSTLGKAAVTGGRLAAQGGVEGALYGASKQLGQDLLEDHESSAEKLALAGGLGMLGGAAGGFALGATGSLASSGLSGLRRAIGGKGAVADAAGALTARSANPDALTAGAASRLDQALAAEREAGAGFAEKALSKVNDKAAMDVARNAAWRSMSAPAGVSKEVAKRFGALGDLPAGQEGIGEVLLRRGILARDAGEVGAAAAGGGVTGRALSALPGDALKTVEAMRVNTPELMYARAVKAQEEVGQEIANALRPFESAKVDLSKVEQAFLEPIKELRESAFHGNIVNSVESQLEALMSKIAPLNPADGKVATAVTLETLIKQRRALDSINFSKSSAMNPGPELEAMMQVGTNLRHLIRDEIERVAEQTGQKAAAQNLRSLNRDYQALSYAEKALETSAARHARNATFSLRGSMMSGGSLLKGLASSILIDRSQAGIAATMANLADAGAVSRTAAKVDQMLLKSARGAVSPTVSATTAPTGNVMKRAQDIIVKVREAQARPDEFVRRANESAAPIGQWSPALAGSLVAMQSRMFRALADKLPVSQLDPMNPDAPPKLTDAEARRVVQLAEYADSPPKIFRDIEAGRIDAQGIAVADELFPGAMAQLRMNIVEEIQRKNAAGKPPSYEDALRLGVILGAPTLPVLRPRNLSRVQAAMAGETAATKGKESAPPRRKSITMPSFTSQLDRIEEKKRR
jgi:hypothetical protein